MDSPTPFTLPKYKLSAFNCPFCGAYARMTWGRGVADGYSGGRWGIKGVDFALCPHCNEWSIWFDEELIYPVSTTVDKPNGDLPEEVKLDYLEASKILDVSPRGSAALLRLAIEKLCASLVDGKGDLNSKIAALVERGLHTKVQQALDIVRVIGNEAVHPGQISLNDTPDVARQLFKLVNIIAHQMITEPNEVNEFFAALPQAAREGITRRDAAIIED